MGRVSGPECGGVGIGGLIPGGSTLVVKGIVGGCFGVVGIGRSGRSWTGELISAGLPAGDCGGLFAFALRTSLSAIREFWEGVAHGEDLVFSGVIGKSCCCCFCCCSCFSLRFSFCESFGLGMTAAPVEAKASFSSPFAGESPRCPLDATAACAMIFFKPSLAVLTGASFHGLAWLGVEGVEGVTPGFGRDRLPGVSAPGEEGSTFFASSQLTAPPFPRGKLGAGLTCAGLGGAQADSFRSGVLGNGSRCLFGAPRKNAAPSSSIWNIPSLPTSGVGGCAPG